MEKPSFTPDSAGDPIPSSDTDTPILSPTERGALPPIDLSDKKMWWFYKNSNDTEIMDIVSATEQWARVMQQQLTKEAAVDMVWMETFVASFDQNATAHCLAKAVAILSRCWEHGDLLRHAYDDYTKEMAHPTDEDLLY